MKRACFILSLLTATFVVDAASAKTCLQPVYKGLATGAILKFEGDTGPDVASEHGTIETTTPEHVFHFTTATSNGMSREYLTLDNLPSEDDEVESMLLRYNPDFTHALGDASFLLTPDLPVKFYYATNRKDQEKLHLLKLDDTWKLIGCTN